MKVWVLCAAVAVATSAAAQSEPSHWEPGHTGPDGVWVPGRRMIDKPQAAPALGGLSAWGRPERTEGDHRSVPVSQRPSWLATVQGGASDDKTEYVYCVGQDADQVFVSDVQPLTPGRSSLDVTAAWQTYLKGRGASGGCTAGVHGKMSAYTARDAAARSVESKAGLRSINYTLWVG